MMNFKVVVPEVSRDEVSNGLRRLTQVLVEEEAGLPVAGSLGGSFGYGTNFKNKVFQIHSYCWCDKEDCFWCGGCQCPESSFHYYIDGRDVSFQDWIDFYGKEVPPSSDPNWEKISDLVNLRRTRSKFPLVCSYCTRLEGENGEAAKIQAPNFWHMESGLKVWWYKYIGREMDVRISEGKIFSEVLQQCLDSLEVKK